jgi:acetoin utilization protein AcuC
LLDAGCERVGYVDVDVHHGDGVQAIFYDDPRVMTVSLHETPTMLFPGTGFPHETGGPGAEGTAVNVALPPGTRDADWLRAFDAVVPEVLGAFKPTVLVSQHGCDSHRQDPLADLELSVDGQRASYLAIAALADELCEGRWVSTGGGGYAVLHVVPRAWTHLLGIVSGEPVPPETPVPAAWLAEVGELDSLTMSDGGDGIFVPFVDGYSPSSRVDQAILATRRAVFPELGLHPDL